jgi:hypothetical protein
MVIVAASATATIHKMVRRLTTGRRCIVIRGGRVFIRTARHGAGEERRGGRLEIHACAPDRDLVLAGGAAHTDRIVQIFESG